MNTLVRGRWVIPGADEATIDDGAVLVEDGRIAALGPFAELSGAHPGAPVLGSTRHAVMPGLINGHHHSMAASHVQQGAPDMLLESWLKALLRMRATPARLDILLSASRLLKSGVTAVVDLYGAAATPEATAAEWTEALDAYDTVGIRCAFGPGVYDQGYMGAGPGDCDAAFLATLPPDLARRAKAMRDPEAGLSSAAYLELMESFCARYADHPRLAMWYGPPGPTWASDGFLVKIAEAARRHGTHIQTHVSESFYEKLQGPKFWGGDTLLHLHDLGLTGPDFSIAHGVWMTDAEIDLLAETGTAVSHNPSSNLRLRAGTAPLNAFLEAGVTTAIGMDSTSMNDDEDMFAEMRLALRLARTPTFHEAAPAPTDVFRCATQGGAKLLGQEGRLGRLAPGYAADLVLVDMTAPCHPWVAPEADGRDLLLYRAKAADVTDVMIDGRVVLRDGKPTGFDLDAAVAELAEVMAATAFPDEAHRFAQEIIPYVEAWYGAWDHPERKPRTAMNSRV